jgi:hypothetical protein
MSITSQVFHMPEAKASGIFVDGQALARSDLAFELLTLEKRPQHGNT